MTKRSNVNGTNESSHGKGGGGGHTPANFLASGASNSTSSCGSISGNVIIIGKLEIPEVEEHIPVSVKTEIVEETVPERTATVVAPGGDMIKVESNDVDGNLGVEQEQERLMGVEAEAGVQEQATINEANQAGQPSSCACVCWSEIESLKEVVRQLSVEVQQLRGKQLVGAVNGFGSEASLEALQAEQNLIDESTVAGNKTGILHTDEEMSIAATNANLIGRRPEVDVTNQESCSSSTKNAIASNATCIEIGQHLSVESFVYKNGQEPENFRKRKVSEKTPSDSVPKRMKLPKSKAITFDKKCSKGGNLIDKSAKENPFDIPRILENIFENCTVEELKACRLVSKVWRENSLKKWQSSARSRIGYEWVGSQPTGCALPEFLEFVSKQDSAYLKTHFNNNYLMYDCIFNLEFWTSCGGSLKSLELRGHRFPSVDAFCTAIFKFCPNMETLILGSIQIEGIHRKDTVVEPKRWTEPQFGENKNLRYLGLFSMMSVGISWMEMLSNFPSLETVLLSGPISNIEGLISSISMIRKQHPDKLQLKCIDTDGLFATHKLPPLSALLSDNNLKIEQVRFKTRSLTDLATTLPTIFTTHASSLKMFDMWGESCHDDLDDDLFQLIEPKIVANNVIESKPKRKSSQKGKAVTSTTLENSISLNLARISTGFTDRSCLKLSNCTSLNLKYCELKRDELLTLMNSLPYLDTLEMELRNETFALVCEHWSNLKSLTVTTALLDDSGVTGLDAEDVTKINKEGENCSWRPITVRKANITSLRHLESFSVKPVSSNVTKRLDCCAAIHGIQQITNLKHLRIQDYTVELKNRDLWTRLHSLYPWPENCKY